MLYNVQNPVQQAMGGMNQAAGTYGRMMPNIPANQKPGPTAGGAIMSGMAAAGTTAAAAGALSTAGKTTMAGAVGGPVGLGVGAVLGIGAYLLS
jgi:hypothetical protein